MTHLEVSGAVRHIYIYIYIYVIRRLKVNEELPGYYLGEKDTEDEMGGACGMYGGEEKFIQGLGGETRQERDLLEYLGVEGKIILKWMWNI